MWRQNIFLHRFGNGFNLLHRLTESSSVWLLLPHYYWQWTSFCQWNFIENLLMSPQSRTRIIMGKTLKKKIRNCGKSVDKLDDFSNWLVSFQSVIVNIINLHKRYFKGTWISLCNLSRKIQHHSFAGFQARVFSSENVDHVFIVMLKSWLDLDNDLSW